MANRYWVDVTGLAGWDDDVLGVTPWATTSGGSDNAVTPVNGDDVFFDTNSVSPPSSGPGSAVSLHNLDFTGFGGTFAASLSPLITITGALTIQGAGVDFSGTLGGTSISIITGGDFTGVADTGASVSFDSVSNITAAFSGTNVVVFNGSPIIQVGTTVGGSGNIFSIGGTTTNNATFNAHGTVTLSGNPNNVGSITASTITISGALIGGGFLIGPTTITGSSDNNITGTTTIDGGTNGGFISGTTSIINGGINNGNIVGNVTISGSASNNAIGGNITGNVTLSSNAKNIGAVSGTLTAPATQNGNGTWGYAGNALGTYGELDLTGIPSGGGGVNPFPIANI